MKKKGQAALEFLMTYGWAIMVVLVAIGALAYFGVLSPDRFLPRKCFLEAGIGCGDFRVNENSVTLVLRNGKGEGITISNIKVKNCLGTTSSTLNNGVQKTFTIDGCNNIPGEKFDGDVNITYTSESGLAHINHGNIVDNVEGGKTTSSIFTDDFTSGAPAGVFGLSEGSLPPNSYSGWTIIGLDFLIEDNTLKSSGTAEGYTIKLDSPSSIPGRSIKARVKENGNGKNAILIFGWQDSSNYYKLQGTTGLYKIFKIVNGESTLLAQQQLFSEAYIWYWMEFRWKSSTELEAEIWDDNMVSLGKLQATVSEGWTTGNYILESTRSVVVFSEAQISSI
jgi:uncharacterized protein (UPF0333 family)